MASSLNTYRSFKKFEKVIYIVTLFNCGFFLSPLSFLKVPNVP